MIPASEGSRSGAAAPGGTPGRECPGWNDGTVTGISTGSGPVRWALAGYGSGGRIFHAPLIASAAGMKLAAVVTRSPDRIEQLRRDHPGVPAVPDLDELVGLGVRGVTVTTPPATHAPLAHRALRSGLDVVVDKPFALTAHTAGGMVDDADGHHRLLIPYQNRRWDNDFLTVRRLVDSGRLGTVHRLTSRLDRSRPVKPGWPSDPDLGGGTLLDLGPHLIDQALVLLGPAVTVYAELDVRREGTGSNPVAEDDIQVHLLHASGARSMLVAGLASPAVGPRFQVQGSRAGVRIEGFDIQEAQLKAGSSPASLSESWGVDPNATAAVTDTDGTTVTVPLRRGRWDTFYPAVAAAVRGDGLVPVDPRGAVAIARVIDAARESARTGRAIDITQASVSAAERRMSP